MSARIAQMRLNAAGYGPLTVDGDIGDQTLAALDRVIADAKGRAGGSPPLVDEALLAALKGDEGCRLTAYPDPLSGGDPWTIGYGATGPGIHKGTAWTPEQAEEALRRMAEEHAQALVSRAPWVKALDPVRRNVLFNMAYNLGVDGLLGFNNTLAMVIRGDYAGAARGMLASKWASQVGNRAKRLAREMETGVAQ